MQVNNADSLKNTIWMVSPLIIGEMQRKGDELKIKVDVFLDFFISE